MSVEVTNKRLFTQIGDQVIVTDIDICQRVLPARVDFEGIEQVVEVNTSMGMLDIEFEGYESTLHYDGEADIPAATRSLASEIADLLEGDGVIVTGRPE
jgi:hypothetical protein